MLAIDRLQPLIAPASRLNLSHLYYLFSASLSTCAYRRDGVQWRHATLRLSRCPIVDVHLWCL